MMLTQARLKELFNYNPETGLFTRLTQVPSCRYGPGTIVDTMDKYGYIVIGIDKKQYKAHRLAFLYMTGKWPTSIDHDKHIKHDNRWSELQEVTHIVNMQNQTMRNTNTTGFNGIYYSDTTRRVKKWRACITVAGKAITLGYAHTKEEAISLRQAANVKYGFHANHGLIKV